jgi:VanZ family protein
MINSQLQGERRRTKLLCIAAVIAILIATLWPFNPFVQNGVTWLQGTRGLKFENAGLVISNAPLKPPETHSMHSYSLELLVRPASWKSGTILGFYNASRPKQLLLVQYGEDLLVTHDEAIQSDITRTSKFDVDHAFRPGKLVLMTISSGSNGTAVYLDGKPADSFPEFRISRGELSGEIILGTSPTTSEPWAGEFRGLAIYSKELTPLQALLHYKEWIDPSGPPDLDGAIARYPFAEAAGQQVRDEVPSGPYLEIPATFSVPHKKLLRSPAEEFKANWKYVKDLLMNIAGFVPLGLILCAYFGWTRSRWKAIFISTIACGILSFVIELLQYYIPGRFSGMTDIITNTLGAALGGVLVETSAVRRVLKRMNLIRS